MQEGNKAFHIKECTLQRIFTFLCPFAKTGTELIFVIVFKVWFFLTLIWHGARQEKRETSK